MRRHAPIVPAWLLIALALPAAAADENAKGEASEEIAVVRRLPQVPLAPSGVPAGMVVIDKSQLRNNGAGGLPESLERIEVVPGPSVISGRNTLAGTNLTTRRGKDGAAFAELSGGSAGFRKYGGGVSGRAGAFDFYLSGSEIQDNGWRAASWARLGKVLACDAAPAGWEN